MSRDQVHSQKIDYIRAIFANQDDALARVGEDLPPEERRMQIGPEEGKILHCLVKMIEAKKIVEIGVLNGYSAIWMARAMAEDGKLYALEKNRKRIAPSKRSFDACGVAKRIELIQGDALHSLRDITRYGPFDMVFIDADKEGYCKYLDWAEDNVRQGGLIVGDNTFLFGAVYGDMTRDIPKDTIDTMQEFNRRLADETKYSSILLPTVEGLTVAMKEF